MIPSNGYTKMTPEADEEEFGEYARRAEMEYKAKEGPELDFYIAETIMGWQRKGPNEWIHPDGGTKYTSVPSYSSFIVAAMDVVRTFDGVTIYQNPGSAEWVCITDNHMGKGQTLALAICRAALTKKENK